MTASKSSSSFLCCSLRAGCLFMALLAAAASATALAVLIKVKMDEPADYVISTGQLRF